MSGDKHRDDVSKLPPIQQKEELLKRRKAKRPKLIKEDFGKDAGKNIKKGLFE